MSEIIQKQQFLEGKSDAAEEGPAVALDETWELLAKGNDWAVKRL